MTTVIEKEIRITRAEIFDMLYEEQMEALEKEAKALGERIQTLTEDDEKNFEKKAFARAKKLLGRNFEPKGTDEHYSSSRVTVEGTLDGEKISVTFLLEKTQNPEIQTLTVRRGEINTLWCRGKNSKAAFKAKYIRAALENSEEGRELLNEMTKLQLALPAGADE